MLSGYTSLDITIIVFAALMGGLRRGGIQGSGIIAVVLLVSNFGAAQAVGMSLIIFIIADIQAIFIFLKDVNWKLLLRLIIPTLFGIAAAAVAGSKIPNDIYEWVIFIIIVIAFGGLLLNNRLQLDFNSGKARTAITLIFGFLSGVTTMIGNMSSIFVTIFLAAVGTTKLGYIATTVWFFFIVNIIKLPIHLFYWETITGSTIVSLLIFLPVVTVGILSGKAISKRLSEKTYWRFVLAVTALSIIRLALSITGIL